MHTFFSICYYGDRLGGRSYLWIIIEINNQHVIVYSTHLESGTGIKDELKAELTRIEQMKQLFDDADRFNQLNVIISGDFNDPLTDLYLDLRFKDRFYDAHSKIPFKKRETAPRDKWAKYDLEVIDYILSNKKSSFIDSALCNTDKGCYGWSDHIPIWSTFIL